MSKQMDLGDRIDEQFPVGINNEGEAVRRDGEYADLEPSYREKQKAAINAVSKFMEDDDVDVILLNAPTGAGKSLIIHTCARVCQGDSFVTTPLNSLVDQIDNDQFISPDVVTLKGRNNYDCIHPEDRGTPVDEAICQRDKDFECGIKDQCPYYGKKARAVNHPEVVTNLSYLMAEGMIPSEVEDTLGHRDYLFVDECQGAEDFGMSFIQFTVSKRAVPDMVWKNISIPEDHFEDEIEYLVEWLEDDVLVAVDECMHQLDTIPTLSKDESKEYEKLNQFRLRVQNFLEDVKENEWVAEMDTDIRKNSPNTRKVVFKPVFIGRFLQNLLWDRADTIVLSSATIPGGNWLEEVGLSDKTVRKVSLGSTFPVDNRKVICNLDVGKMVSTYSDDGDNRETNAWDMAKRIMNIAIHHEGEKGLVHCRSYSIMKLLKRQFTNHHEVEIDGQTYKPMRWFRNNVMMQDRYDREGSLQEWQNSDKQVFLSVAMDEGIDLDGDKCRWQVLAKTLYPFMTKRMKRRKELAEDGGNSGDFWDYYNRKAVMQIQQAAGRAVRSKDDWAVFYILDSSAVQNQGLIQMNASLFNKWFLEAVEGIKVDPRRGL